MAYQGRFVVEAGDFMRDRVETAEARGKALAHAIRRLAGVELSPVGHRERLVSAVTGCLAIYGMLALERTVLGEMGAALVVASMGASAVLLFAVPHGALSQPWPVIAGHAVSALIGVTIARFVPDVALAAALAVGLAIGAMHYLRAIHPPGGASALTAVIGGTQVHDLGYSFVAMPVLLNATIMVALAVVLNAAFAWRRYPSAWGRREAAAPPPVQRLLTHADFVEALGRIGTFVDVSETEFLRLERLMHEAATRRQLRPEDIRLGAYYANGAPGESWSVRRIIDSGHDGRIIWRSVAGQDRNASGVSTRAEFVQWARYEVSRVANAWTRRPDTQQA